MQLLFQPMPLLKRRLPFDDPDWLFELKYDGFRAICVIEHGRAHLLSRNGHSFASFVDLGKHIAAVLPTDKLTVLDGEICSLDKRGKPQFNNLLFRRGNAPCFLVFDSLIIEGYDCRTDRLIDRKQELRKLLAHLPANASLKCIEYVHGSGKALFQRVCELDLEGIVAKQKGSPYVSDRESSTWFKIRNQSYSQVVGTVKSYSKGNGIENLYPDGILVLLRLKRFGCIEVPSSLEFSPHPYSRSCH